MNNYPVNGAVGKHLQMLKQRSAQRRLLRKWLLIAFVLMLLGSTVLLSGCATRLPVPCDPPIQTSKPVPDMSPPSVSYSQQVQNFLEESQKKLMSGQPKP
jgi:hypothetical protein